MTISDTVSLLASQLSEQWIPESEEERRMVSLLRQMPDYVAARDLSTWDDLFPIPDAPSELGKLLVAIYDLASFNMYGAINADKTFALYRSLVESLQRYGVLAPSKPDLTAW